MPSLNDYRQNLKAINSGEAKKNDADMIIEATWWDDMQSQIMYLYDWYHDNHKTQLNNMDINDTDLIPIDAKFIVASSQTYAKDPITYRLQFRPSQECNVPYYDRFYGDVYDSMWPVGLYCNIKDSKGRYNRWLVVDRADYNDPQFPTFELLRCDYVIQYVFEGKKYNVPGVLRSQNSYNSGLWMNYKVEVPEDQQKAILPLNRDTEHIYYNQRMLIDSNVLTEPRAWRVSKINRISPKGIINATLAQDHFDQEHDFIEIDDNGNVIGMWADYFARPIMPVPENKTISLSSITSEIKFTGTKPILKIGGSYKKFTVVFINQEISEEEFYPGEWLFSIDGENAEDLITVMTSNESSSVKDNEIKVRFDGDDTYIGKILEIKYVPENLPPAKLLVEIGAL